MTVTVTVTAATAMMVVRRSGPGDVGKDDREHSGRAHQADSRTHTHTQHVHTTLCSLVCSPVCSLAAERARVSIRRTKKKRKEETPRKRDPRRHQALRASSLSASSCTTRTYPRIPLGETRRKTSGESALSLARIVSLRVVLPSARAPRTPSPSTPIAPFPFLSATPRQPPTIPGTHSLRPPLCHPFSIRVSFLSIYPPRLLSRDARSPFSLSLSLSLTHSLSPPLFLSLSVSETSSLLSKTSIRSLFLPLSFSFPLSPSAPREEICRADSFSSRKSRHLRPRSCAPWQRDSLLSTGGTDDVNGVRSPTNVQLPIFAIVVATCSIQCIWIPVPLTRVCLVPTNVDDDNVMGVIERKPPSSFSRRSPSGNGRLRAFPSPHAFLPLRVPYPASLIYPSSIQPRSFSLIPFRSPLPHLPSPPTLFLSFSSYDFRLSRTSSRINHFSPFLSMLLPPLCFLLQPPPTPGAYGATHTVAFRLFYPLAASDPRVSSPRRALRQPPFSSP